MTTYGWQLADSNGNPLTGPLNWDVSTWWDVYPVSNPPVNGIPGAADSAFITAGTVNVNTPFGSYVNAYPITVNVTTAQTVATLGLGGINIDGINNIFTAPTPATGNPTILPTLDVNGGALDVTGNILDNFSGTISVVLPLLGAETFAGTFSNGGTIDLTANGTLEVGGTVGTAIIVGFDNQADVLKLDGVSNTATSAFAGVIQGFTVGNSIVLSHLPTLNVVSDSYNTATDMLTVTDSTLGTLASLHVVPGTGQGAYSTGNFKVTKGTNSVTITEAPLPPPPSFSWKSAVSADWATAADWTPAGPPNAANADATIAVTGAYTVTIGAAESFVVDSLTFDPATSGVLALNGKLTLGGTLAAMNMSSGTVNLAGTIAGGALTLTGGLLSDTGTGFISSAAFLNGGTVAVASGKTLTLSGGETLNGVQIDGPGTLTTTGATSITGQSNLDGSLVWNNIGTVSAGTVLLVTGAPSATGKVTVNNQAGGAIDLTTDGQALFSVTGGSTLAFNNAGVLSKTGGTGVSNLTTAVTNTGTLTATSGTLELDAGAVLGGTIGATGAGTLALNGGTFTVGGTTQAISGRLALEAAFVSITSGKTLTLSGTPNFEGITIVGPGTLATTGAASITAQSYLDGSLVWDNSGTVADGALIYTGYSSGAGKVTIANQAGGVFDLTADGQAFSQYGTSTLALSNAGVLSKTAGTGVSNITNALTNTGTLTATSGTLELDAGGTLGGTVTETTTGAVTLGSGVFALTGTVIGAGTLTVDSGATLAITTVSEAIANATVLDGAVTVASGKTLTLSGPTTWASATIAGPGTLATTGATSITATPFLDGNLVWNNTGTVSAGAQIYTGYPSGTGNVTIANKAGGAFDLTADGQAFYQYGTSTLAFSNAGVMSKTAGSGVSNINNAITNTGTLTATSGTLELDGGGTLGGTVAETTTGAVTLGTGVFALTGTVNGAGTLTIDSGATLAITTVSEAIASATVLDGTVTVATGKTLTLSGPTTWASATITGPGTLATTGATSITATPFLDGNLAWNNTGTVSAGTQIYTGYPSGTGNVTIANKAGGAFDLTADGQAFYQYGTSTLALTNAGVLSKTGGTGISNISSAITNTGTLTATSGTLELDGGGTLGGTVTETTTGAVTLGGGVFALTGTVNGAGTLTVDAAATLAITTVSETIANAGVLDGMVTIAGGETLTLSGPATWTGDTISGPGTLATTGATSITATSFLDGSLVWDNTGTVSAAAMIYTGYPSGTGNITISNQSGGVFDLTADGQSFYQYGTSTLALSNAGVISKTAGVGISNITNAITNTGTLTATSGTLELDGGGTLGGTVTETKAGAVTLGSGVFALTGTVNGAGTLTVDSAATLAIATVNQAIADAVVVDGTVTIAGGTTLTLSGPVTLASAAQIDGPGTLATSGATSIMATPYLDGGLVWNNTGTVSAGAQIFTGYSSGLGNVTIANMASGAFDLTADGAAFYVYGSSTLALSNAGVLSKTGGTGVSTISVAVVNTGTMTATSGTLELDGGGVLSGKIGATGAGTLALNVGTFTLGGATQTITGALALEGGAVDIGSGQTLTLSGAVTWDGADMIGPGTLATTGTTTISNTSLIDGGLTWTNSGKVLDSAAINVDSVLQGSTLANAIVNQATGIFNFTSDGFSTFYDGWNSSPITFTNAGLLEKTAGTGILYFDAALNNTGTIAVSAGILSLNSGGMLGGKITTTAGATLAFSNGAFAVTGTIVNGGSLVMEPAGAASTTVTFGATKETIAGAVGLYGGSLEIATGQTLTLSGAVNWGSGYVVGPGMLATTGTTTLSGIGGGPGAMDGGLTWTNSGTVLGGSSMLYGFYDTSSLSYALINQAAGTFDFTSDGFTAFGYYDGATSTFTNAGLLEKTAGTGTVNFNAALTNTGAVTSTSGTLDISGSGTLNGTIGGTGTGVVLIDGAGGTFVTTGTLAITDAGTANDLRIGNGGTLTDSGLIKDSGHLVLGNASGASALVIAAGGTFDFTTNDGNILNGAGASLSNAGTIGKTGGTGTSAVGIAFTNTGIVDAASGTLKLAGAVSGTGRLQIEAGDTLELASGAVGGFNTIDFNGLGATLKIDTNSTVSKPIIGMGAGSRIDLAVATGAAAVINGNTLTITPTGGTALNFVSATSLAGLHATTGSDGGTGTVVTLYAKAIAAQHTPEPVAFGNVHVGATANKAVSVTNSAPGGIYTEKLDGALTSSAAGFTATGGFTGLAGGATNSNALSVTLNTVNSGTIGGTGTLTLNSDGAGIDGFGTTALAGQTVNVTGAVYAYAAPNPSTTTLNFGAARVGGPVLVQSLTLGDGTVANAYQERLVYSAGAAPSEFSISNGSGTIASGSSVTVGATLATATAGDFTGSTISVGLTSTGVGTSGLTDTPLTAETVTLNGKIYAAAVTGLSATSVNFGVVHVGDGVSHVVSQSLSVTNAATGALTDILAGGTDTLGGNYTGPVGFSIGAGLTAGASGTVSFGLSTAASGVVSGSAVLGFTSHDANLADLAMNGGTVTVSATVDNYATAQVEDVGGVGTLTGSGTNYALNLGGVLQGGTALVGDLGVLNAASGLADLLAGTFAVTGASTFNNTGLTAGFSGLGAGQDERNQIIVLNTGTAGVFTETIVLTPTGSNANYLAVLAKETITVTGSIIPAGVTYAVTGAPVTITGGIGNDTFTATNATLNSHDSIDGGGGTNTLVLSGPGAFDLGAPALLANIQVVDAAEGQAGGAGVQTIYMRNGANMTVNVASGTPIVGNANPEAITIYGAAAGNVYNLGGGTDTVVLGGAGETVNGGGGTAILSATTVVAAALINGGTGKTTLTITNGGTATLNTADNHLIVDLTAPTNLTLSKMGFITANGSTGADAITAMAQGQTLSGGGGTDTLNGYSGFGDMFSDTSAHLNSTTIGQFGGSDLIDLTDMNSSLIKPLAYNTSTESLTVTDGTHTSNIKFIGSYTLSDFQIVGSDGHTGSLIKFV